MKILNLYAGIGGNRRLWGDNHEIVAVENDKDIAQIYQDHFPNDKVIVCDAHEYLLEHYKEFDFIWSSPPCPTHSILYLTNQARLYDKGRAQYPEMSLYQEIILLRHSARKDTKRVVENVKPYYDLLIPAQTLERHSFWSNFIIPPFRKEDTRKHQDIKSTSTVYGFNLAKYDVKDKRKLLRNMVNPDLAKHILDSIIDTPTSLFS